MFVFNNWIQVGALYQGLYAAFWQQAKNAFILGRLEITKNDELKEIVSLLANQMCWTLLRDNVQNVGLLTSFGNILILHDSILEADDTLRSGNWYLNLSDGVLAANYDLDLGSLKHFLGLPVLVQFKSENWHTWEFWYDYLDHRLINELIDEQVKNGFIHSTATNDLATLIAENRITILDGDTASFALAAGGTEMPSPTLINPKMSRIEKRNAEKDLARGLLAGYAGGQFTTKAEAKAILGKSFGERSFNRAWDIAAEAQPELSAPGRKPLKQ